jgi:uncharacterized membrane protein
VLALGRAAAARLPGGLGARAERAADAAAAGAERISESSRRAREAAAEQAERVAETSRRAREAAVQQAERIAGGSRRLIDSAAEFVTGPKLAAALEHGPDVLAERVRRLPIQRSVDIAVPLHVVYGEWMRLDFLPEGAYRVQDIERQGERLTGQLSALRGALDWEAEIRDERENESFAWRSVKGSDCAGLVTFHSLSERLTRIELELDVVPSHVGEAISLLGHVADRRAEADLRRFKARLETINPDDYPPPNERADKEDE